MDLVAEDGKADEHAETVEPKPAATVAVDLEPEDRRRGSGRRSARRDPRSGRCDRGAVDVSLRKDRPDDVVGFLEPRPVAVATRLAFGIRTRRFLVQRQHVERGVTPDPKKIQER